MEHSRRGGGRRPDALSTGELARRLIELAGDERQVQVDFLLHLDAFDRRRAWREAGYGSLWEYCREKLHLSEGAAGRRTNAMRVLRRFPRLEPALRDGRLSLTTVTLLAPVLDEANLDALIARAAHGSRVDVQRITASLQPRPEPRQGIRLVSAGADAATSAPAARPAPSVALGAAAAGPTRTSPGGLDVADGPAQVGTGVPSPSADVPAPPAPPLALVAPPAPPRDEFRPIDAERWSVRVTLGGRAKADLDLLTDLLSHKTGRDLGAVIHEAIRCALEKHGKRRGAVAPQRARKGAPAAAERSRGPRSRALARVGAGPGSAPAPAGAAGAVPGAGQGLGPGSDAAPAPAPAPVQVEARVHAGAQTRAEASARAEARAEAEVSAPHTPDASPGAEPSIDPRSIPIALRRQVWARDGGQCTYVAPDGRRCRSRWKLELHHEEPAARGGPATLSNVSLRCKPHNLLAAERDFGRAHMARFTRRDPEAREELARYGARTRALAVERTLSTASPAAACGPAP